MRVFPLTLVVALLAAAGSVSAQTVNAPSGNSGLSQYLEVVPGSSGNKSGKGGGPPAGPAAPAQSQPAEPASDEAASQEPKKEKKEKRVGVTAGLLSRFVAATAPSTRDAPSVSKQEDSGRAAAVTAAVAGDDAGAGMGLWLPILMALAVVAAVAAYVRRRSGTGPGMRSKPRWLVLPAVIAIWAPVTAAEAAPALRLGFSDTKTVQEEPLQRPLELEHLKATRATTIRLMWEWTEIERTRPPDDATARDPGWAGYDWSALDATLRDISAAGLTPLIEVSRAPSWWEGPGRPRISTTARRGTWRPDPAAFGRFMHAAARRYSGAYPDPDRPGQPLPLVIYWQPWNEANLAAFLSPQWIRTKTGYRPASPSWYRSMLSRAYDEIKSASPTAIVVAGGTAPYSEPRPGGTRMPPALFAREWLCVSGRSRPRARNCRSNPVKFDVLAHHPYPIGPPGRHAINPDDVGVPDFFKLKRPLAVALKAGNVFPRTSKPIWATEMSWDSKPPDPHGVSLARQARYAAGAMHILLRQGVSAMIWWNLRDDPKDRGYQFGLQSGVYLRGPTVAADRAKPLLTAFRFPFVAYAPTGGRAKVWGMAPSPGAVAIQRLTGGSWKTIAKLSAGGNHLFQSRVSARRGARLRAVQTGEASIDAQIT